VLVVWGEERGKLKKGEKRKEKKYRCPKVVSQLYNRTKHAVIKRKKTKKRGEKSQIKEPMLGGMSHTAKGKKRRKFVRIDCVHTALGLMLRGKEEPKGEPDKSRSAATSGQPQKREKTEKPRWEPKAGKGKKTNQ